MERVDFAIASSSSIVFRDVHGREIGPLSYAKPCSARSILSWADLQSGCSLTTAIALVLRGLSAVHELPAAFFWSEGLAA